MITNRKAQALAVAFLATLATGQAQAERGFTSKVDVGQVFATAGGIKATAVTQVGNSCGDAKGSSEVKAKQIFNTAGGIKSKSDLKIGTVGC